MTRNPMLLKLRAVLVVLLLAAVGYVAVRFGRGRAATAASAGPGALWVVDDGVLLRGDARPVAKNAIWDGQTIHLTGLRNEVVAWQVAVKPSEPAIGVQVKVEPLTGKGTIPTQAIAIFKEHYLEVKVPSQLDANKPAEGRLGTGWYPNQLLPLKDGQAADAPADRVSSLWFDLTIPAEAKPGTYQGKLTVAAGNLQQSWPLELTVLPLELPSTIHFRNWFYYGPERLGEFYGVKNDDAIAAYERAYLQLAHDHRASMATEPAVGNGHYNWDRWWARYGGYLDGSAFTKGPCRNAGAPLWPVAIVPDVSDADFAAACVSTVKFFSEKGLLDRVFTSSVDEPNDQEAYEKVRTYGTKVHAAVGHRLPVMVTEQVQPQEPSFGSLLDAVDIFCSDRSSDQDMELVRRRGGQIWVYNGGLAGGPYIDCPSLGVAAWGPAAWRYGLGGWYLWDTLYWRQTHYQVKQPTDLYNDPLTFDETKRVKDGKPYPAAWAMRLNGDGVMLYPGEPMGVAGPVGCVRLKAFRRGAQDYEYLWLLREQGKGALADSFSRKLSKGRHEYETDPDRWQQIRREMANALMGMKS